MKTLPAITLSLSLCLSLPLLVACGGGGGGGGDDGGGNGSSSVNQDNTAADTYTPDGSRLLSAANASDDLYVEPVFDFRSSQNIQLYISAVDGDNAPLTYSRISVYLIPGTITEWNDELMDQAELLTRGITNADGLFNRQLDIPDHGQQLLLVLDAMGFENKQLVTIDGTSLTHQFN
ncbi:MAG: hypothetical protein VYA55_07430 [Pseudomonadota bacterium]|nr:hypothetical protein [Pseudomonadota bacterium]